MADDSSTSRLIIGIGLSLLEKKEQKVGKLLRDFQNLSANSTELRQETAPKAIP